MVLLLTRPIEGARRVADSLRRQLSERLIQWKDETVAITASFGATNAKPSEDRHANLYRTRGAWPSIRAKDQGRNCVRLSSEPAVA